MAQEMETAAPGTSRAAAEGICATKDTGSISGDTAKGKARHPSAVFLSAFVGDPRTRPWILTAIAGRAIETRTFDTEQAAVDWIESKVLNSANVYFNPAMPKGRLTKKATKDDMSGTRWLWADADPVKLQPDQAASMNEAGCRAYYEKERGAILAAVAGVSPPPTVVIDSGNGFQCFWQLDSALTDQGAIERKNLGLIQQFGDRADVTTRNVDRIMRLPATTNFPNDIKRKAGITWTSPAKVVEDLCRWDVAYSAGDFREAPLPAAAKQAVVPIIAAPDLSAISQIAADKHARLRRLIETGGDPDRETPFPSRSEPLWAAVGGMLRAGCEDAIIAAVITDPRNRISESVLEKGQNAAAYAQRQIAQARAKDLDFQETRAGRISNYFNTRLAVLKLGLVCEYDVFKGQLQIGGNAMQMWQGDLTDNSVAILRQIILETYGFDPKLQNVRDAAFALCLENRFNPVVERLAQLEPTWDGVKRIDNWLTTYMGAEDTELNRAIGKRVLVAAVRRARRPGTKFDHVLVFEDPLQGTGKSTAIRTLSLGFFSDEDLFDLDKKGRIEALQGVWIYELGELTAVAPDKLASSKSFITRLEDQVRPAYGRYKERWLRQCIFIASTNESNYLTDNTGNRRWWPVATGTINLQLLADDVAQLWAEAAQAETAGFDIRLPEALWAVARLEQAKRTPPDAWEDMLAGVEGALFPNDEGQQVRRVSSKALMTQHLGIPAERQKGGLPKRLKKVMTKLGWTYCAALNFGGDERGTGYERQPEAETAAPSEEEGAPF